MIAEPARTTKLTKTLKGLISASSPKKVIRSGVIELRLSDYELIYCSRKATLFKLNEHCEISLSSMKNFHMKFLCNN